MYIRLTWHIVRYPIATKKEYLKPETGSEDYAGQQHSPFSPLPLPHSPHAIHPKVLSAPPQTQSLCSPPLSIHFLEPFIFCHQDSTTGSPQELYELQTPGPHPDIWASLEQGTPSRWNSSAQLEPGAPDLEGLALGFSSSQTIALTPDLCKIRTSVTLPTTPSLEHFVLLASVLLVCFPPLWLILPRLLPSFSFSAYSLGVSVPSALLGTLPAQA